MRKNIAVVTGGNSSEYEVSLRSADLVELSLDKSKYNIFRVVIKDIHWFVQLNNSLNVHIDKNDFSFTYEGRKYLFDCALIIIHGTPGEDGLLQAYFELLNIPYTTSNVMVSALTFNKWACKNYLKNADVKMPKGILIRKEEKLDAGKIVEQLGLPIFVKPNEGGSSFGVTKVKSFDDMQKALNNAFKEDVNVIAEEFISGIELTCGLMQDGANIVAFPITEIISKKEFFDYEAKYTPGMSDEITPARISTELTMLVKNTSEVIYSWLGCKGIVRIDYIYNEEKNELFFLEVNTVPGMTENSLVPKQIKAMGKSIADVISTIIEESLQPK